LIESQLTGTVEGDLRGSPHRELSARCEGEIKLEEIFEEKTTHRRIAERSFEVMKDRKFLVETDHPIVGYDDVIHVIGNRDCEIDVAPAIGLGRHRAHGQGGFDSLVLRHQAQDLVGDLGAFLGSERHRLGGSGAGLDVGRGGARFAPELHESPR
jgi:hypothetical protein